MSGHQELPVTGVSALGIGIVGAVMVAVGWILTFGARVGAKARGGIG